MANLQFSPAPYKSRNQLRLEAHGLISETFPHAANQNTILLSTQRLVCGLLGLRVGDVVTGVVVAVTVNSASLTLARTCLYDLSGNLLASSANTAANYDAAATSKKTLAFSSPYTVTSSGGYYAGLLCVGTTPPTIARGVNQNYQEGVGSGAISFVGQSSQADLPSTATLTEDSVSYWIGVY